MEAHTFVTSRTVVTIDSLGWMSVASGLCLLAPPGRTCCHGPVRPTNTRKVRLQVRRRLVYQQYRYPKGAVRESNSLGEVQVGQSPESFLTDPTLANTVQRIKFNCWTVDLAALLRKYWKARHAGIGQWGLPGSLFNNFTPQEQAELLSIAVLATLITQGVNKG